MSIHRNRSQNVHDENSKGQGKRKQCAVNYVNKLLFFRLRYQILLRKYQKLIFYIDIQLQE